MIGEYRDGQGKPALLAPLVRYVECKCLLGGVTTTQGIMLSSNAGVQRFYRGIVEQATGDPDVSSVSLRTAKATLGKAFRDLPKLARELEKPKKLMQMALDAPKRVVWSLALDEIQPTGVDQRPRLPFRGPKDFTGPDQLALRAAAQPLSKILQPIVLDPLTVADDRNFLKEIAEQPNVPEAVRAGLAELY